MPICDFGCGKEATHQFKSSGKWCCSTNLNACEGMKAKNSQAKKGITPNWKNGHPKAALGKTSHTKGKTYEELYGVDKAILLKNKIKENKSPSLGRCKDPMLEIERRKKISIKMSEVGGGYRQGSGRGKKGWYKGYWCDSSWELAWVVYNIEHGIKFERNLTKFPYEYDGKTYNWMPDFLMEDGTYVEIKGYETDQVKAKFNSFTQPLKILMEFDIEPMIQYTISKYGKDFISIYENG